MSIRDAEKLLGGYATGTLTEAERRDLMAAALEHQVLFDALMDEEALRGLLADPSARAELLAALAGPSKSLPFWRRHPGVLGLAASLLIAVTAGVAYLRTPTAIQPSQAPALPSPAEAPAPAAEAVPPAKPLLRKEREQAAPPQADASGEALRSEPLVLPEATAQGAPPPPSPLPQAKAVEEADFSRAKAKVAKEAPEAKAERRTAPGAPAAGYASGAALHADRANQAVQDAYGALAPGVRSESPSCTFETTPEGARRLRVQHAPGRWVYLLRRTPGGPVLIAPLPPPAEGPGITRFPLPQDPGPLDLFVLDSPAPEPLKLPAEGPFPGHRVRLDVPKP